MFYRINRIPIKRRARVTKSGHAYVDEKTKADLKAVKEAYKGKLYTCPVEVVALVYKDMPKTTPKKVEAIPFTQKPDIDNCVKCLLDGLNGVAYLDDAQVVSIHCLKRNRKRGYGEYCEFAVFPVEEEVNKYE